MQVAEGADVERLAEPVAGPLVGAQARGDGVQRPAGVAGQALVEAAPLAGVDGPERVAGVLGEGAGPGEPDPRLVQLVAAEVDQAESAQQRGPAARMAGGLLHGESRDELDVGGVEVAAFQVNDARALVVEDLAGTVAGPPGQRGARRIISNGDDLDKELGECGATAARCHGGYGDQVKPTTAARGAPSSEAPNVSG